MSDYTCPNCRGGFTEPPDEEYTAYSCPWCGTKMDGMYEHEPLVKESIVRTEDSENNIQTAGILDKLGLIKSDSE